MNIKVTVTDYENKSDHMDIERITLLSISMKNHLFALESFNILCLCEKEKGELV